jgi:hypothetical protein
MDMQGWPEARRFVGLEERTLNLAIDIAPNVRDGDQ